MRKTNYFIWILFFAAIAVALLRIRFEHIPNQYESLYDSKISTAMEIVSDPQVKDRLAYFEIIPADGQISQKILVTSLSSNYAYGDEIYVSGKIKKPKPIQDFDYPAYLEAKDIYAQMSSPEVFVLAHHYRNYLIYSGIAFKHFIFSNIQKRLSADQAALLISLISGDKSYLTSDLSNSFNLTGTAHMIAVSGYKLTIIFIALERLGPFIGRKKVWVISGLFCWMYLVMADFAPAVLRAAIMSGLFLAAKEFGRKYELLNALIFTAAIQIFFQPRIIFYDIGFLLSISGILGIIYFGPYIKLLVCRVPDAYGIKEIFVSTTAAQIATFPLMLYFFHQLSYIAPLANILIVPLLVPCVLFAYGLVIPLAANLCAMILMLPLTYMVWVVESLVRIPYAYVFLNLGPIGLISVYSVEIVLLLVFLKWLKTSGSSAKINS